MATGTSNIPAPILYLRDRFGGDFDQAEATVSVGTTATRLVYNDPEAVSLVIVNLGTATVYIAPSPTVSTTSGIQLGAAGGQASMDVRSDFTLPSREWWAISGTSGQSIYTLRLKRYTVVPTG